MEKRIEKLITAYTPFPACIINEHGKVTKASSKIDEVFIYDGIKDADIFVLTGIKYCEFLKQSEEGTELFLSRNDKIFKILTSALRGNTEPHVLICFLDVTNYETLKAMYQDEQLCIGVVSIDNFDELLKADNYNSVELISEVDKTIRQWAIKINASIIKYRDHLYMMVMQNVGSERLVESRFSILDDVREIESDTDFPVTLSIGIGIGGKTPAKNDQFAHAALDLALGRGGDQAVIKRDDTIEYYGGKMQTVEKSNKGKSRIVAHAIRHLIDQSSNVMIMGHRNPDMDSFGSALGVFRLAANAGKEVHIVINKYNDNLAEVYKQANETELYSIINNEKALSLVDKETLLVIVDTHRACVTDCPELIDATDKIVVIDHHRKAEDFIDHATLVYMEPYASSTSELVAEILQYSSEKDNLKKFEAEALLAGITVDTNRFAGRTGVRTFEAASWLRRMGADTSGVKRFFQSDIETFKIKADCVANAQFLEGGIALSICAGSHPEMQIINSQAAEILLEIKGMRASFVAGLDDEGTTVVSARSLGDINVQLIMEELGGGGHLTTAGAQITISPEEAIEKIKEILIK